MIKKLPCLYRYIGQTKTGDRNTNLFKAINHLFHYNETTSIEDILNEALQINKAFESPLSKDEVTVICQHVIKKKYRTTCWKFKSYCQHCRHGEFSKRWCNSKPGYWKHINENNRLINIKTIADDSYYPWDFVDTSKLNQNERSIIQQFREEKGIPIAIDQIIKSYGIPIGDKAKREWERFREAQ